MGVLLEKPNITMHELSILLKDSNLSSLIIPPRPNFSVKQLCVAYILLITPNITTNFLLIHVPKFSIKNSHDINFIVQYKTSNLLLFY